MSVSKSEERREAVVGFTTNSDLAGKPSGLTNGINDPLMTLRLRLSVNNHVTIVSAYAATMTNPDEVKNKFCDDIIICNIPYRQAYSSW